MKKVCEDCGKEFEEVVELMMHFEECEKAGINIPPCPWK